MASGRKKVVCAGSVFAGALLIISAASTGVGTAAPRVVPKVNFSTNVDANQAASDVGQVLLNSLAKVPGFANLRITSDGLEIDTVGDPSAQLTSLVSAVTQVASMPVDIIYRQVSNSYIALQDAQSRIESSISEWAAKGVKISSDGMSAATNTINLTLSSYTPEAAAMLTASYPGLVTVQTDAKTFEPTSGRNADTSPWAGGDGIYVGAGGQCTTSFSLYSTGNSTDYNATAAHCGSGQVLNGSHAQGTATAARTRWTDHGNTDVVVYPVSANVGVIFADPTTTTRAVTSRATADPEGTRLCTGGVVDREVCSVAIFTSPFGFQETSSIYLVSQVYCQQDTQSAAFTPGDSGGPVYAGKNGSTEAQAFGMLIAEGQNAQHAPLPWTGVYTPFRNIFAAYDNLTFKPY